MKVEYSYFGHYPSLVVKGTDFMRAMRDDGEKYLLQIAVDGFAEKFEIASHFDDDVNDAIQQWLSKGGSVIYTIKGSFNGRIVTRIWSEVYVQNGGSITEVVISNNEGRGYMLNRKGVSKDE